MFKVTFRTEDHKVFDEWELRDLAGLRLPAIGESVYLGYRNREVLDIRTEYKKELGGDPKLINVIDFIVEEF